MRHDLVETAAPSTCRYGASPLLFRAPARQIISPFMACLGGSATFGTTDFTPYPVALQRASKTTCINFGTRDGGLETILHDPVLLSLVSPAEALILEVGEFWHLSNRFYTVHPRQSSRLSQIGTALQALWPASQTTSWDYVEELRDAVPQTLQAAVRAEMDIAWEARLRSVLTRRAQPIVLLGFEPAFEPIFARLQSDFPRHGFITFASPQSDESNEALGALLARTVQSLL